MTERSPGRPGRGRQLGPAVVPVVLSVTVLAAACTAAPETVEEAGASSSSSSSSAATAPAEQGRPAEPATFAVVGDSITAGGVAISDTRVEGTASWVPAAAESSGLSFAGGWAVPGATTGDMLAAEVPDGVDVVVLMAGTNDLLQGRPWAGSAADLTRIAEAAGDATVVTVAIAPSDVVPDARQAYNAELAALAAERGWVFLDPWTEVDAGGRFVPGTTTDGTHLPDEVAASVGRRLGELLAGLG